MRPRQTVKREVPNEGVSDMDKPGEKSHRQIVLVLQGGGALGAYQAGVYQALHEAGLEPDWIVGTSIGAINAALIAGNAPEHRLSRLTSFWRKVGYDLPANVLSSLPWGGPIARMMTVVNGIQGFFTPNREALFGSAWPLGAEAAAHYSTAPLRATLGELVDFDRINQRKVRVSVGAASVCTGQMRYFDSRDLQFTIDHVMASGALPPAFPAVRIDNELYWDGGILSNTPLEAIFDDNPRRNALIFSVHVWNPAGTEPSSIGQVITRQKDVQFASRSQNQIMRQKQLHKLRRVITELVNHVPEPERSNAAIRELAEYGCVTQMHVVSLQAPMIDMEDHMKDIDFSGVTIKSRWEAGYGHTRRAIEQAAWEAPVDPLEGVVLHQVSV
jgi:NTE family protein